MSDRISRRGLLAGALASVGTATFANAPLTAPRPVPRGGAPVIFQSDPTAGFIAKANLGGDIGFVLRDLDSGEVLAARDADLALPPASTLKAVTALYGLERLGAGHTFRTRLLTTGGLSNGRIEGDLILISDGDPTLDTDRLLELAKALKAAGVTSCSGRFLVWGGALPEVDRIAAGQPDVAGYNPAVGGLNLNFNRVHFNWKREGDGYDTSLLARGVTASPETTVARVQVVEEQSPVFVHATGHARDFWTVAEGALGKEGARWLPVRHPARYAGDVFRALAKAEGVRLPSVELADGPPSGARDLAEVAGPALQTVLRGMLKYSTNLTAEVTGLRSSLSNGVPVANLVSSGARMSGWAIERFGVGRPRFVDHSGLGYRSAMTAEDMSKILQGGADTELPQLLKSVNLALDNKNPAPAGAAAFAKTGTLNFVNSLAGYIDTSTGRRAAFAIFCADVARRDAVPLGSRDRPNGGRSYARRARVLQKQLLRYWASIPA